MTIVITPRTVAALNSLVAAEQRAAERPSDYQPAVWLEIARQEYEQAQLTAVAAARRL